MKVSAFAQVGYRTFPEDFEQHHDSSVDTPWRLADPREVRAAFRDYLDGLMLAARSGFDGVVFTEHAQASYDMSANPSLTASALAYATESEGLDVAIFPAGRSLGKSREPMQRRRRIRGDRHRQRRPVGGRVPGRAALRRVPQQRHSANRAAATLRRKPRVDPARLAGRRRRLRGTARSRSCPRSTSGRARSNAHVRRLADRHRQPGDDANSRSIATSASTT